MVLYVQKIEQKALYAFCSSVKTHEFQIIEAV